MRNEEAMRPMRYREARSRLRGGSVEGQTCCETVLSTVRREAAARVEMRLLRGTQTASRILCLAREAIAHTRWHATLQRLCVSGIGLSFCSARKPTLGSAPGPPPAKAAASNHRCSPTRDRDNHGAEGTALRANRTGCGATRLWPKGCRPYRSIDYRCRRNNCRNERKHGVAATRTTPRPRQEKLQHIPVHMSFLR